MLVYEGGHFYVCGDCTMAENVYQTLKQIIQTHGELADKQVEAYMLSLRVSHAQVPDEIINWDRV